LKSFWWSFPEIEPRDWLTGIFGRLAKYKSLRRLLVVGQFPVTAAATV
jgi:hypothetical protein